MSQLRRLKDCILQTSNKVKQTDGNFIESYIDVKPYKITLQELVDAVSASVYGANISKTFRINSPYHNLENYLSTKVSNDKDNISKYYILIDNKRYKIVSVKLKWIDIELL